MSTNDVNLTKCSEKELRILGDFWTLELIQTLATGEKRFSQLERDLPEINPTTLTNRLKRMEDQEIINRKEETLDKLSVVYFLTEKGLDIIPILKQIKDFADKHL